MSPELMFITWGLLTIIAGILLGLAVNWNDNRPRYYSTITQILTKRPDPEPIDLLFNFLLGVYGLNLFFFIGTIAMMILAMFTSLF